MAASYKASERTMTQLASKNAKFKKIYDAGLAVPPRTDPGFCDAENPFDNFMTAAQRSAQRSTKKM